MRNLTFILIFFASTNSFSNEDCDIDSIGLGNSSSAIEKYFYTGTCYYRNKEYHLSVENWEKLARLKATKDGDEELKVDVLNNLGYMKFFGYGTEEDKVGAIEYWRQAILLGHYEAEYHLCHVYADSSEPTYNKAKARKHCEKAKLIYKGKSGSDPEILKSIEIYLDKISR